MTDKLLTLIEKGTSIMQSSPRKALAIFKKALDESELNSNEEFRAKSLFNIAITYLILCDFNRSISYFQNALETEFGKNDLELQAEILRGIAENHTRNYNFKEALKYYYLSENASIQSWNLQNLHMVYQGIASLYTKLNLNEKALSYTKKSLDIAVQIRDNEPLQASLMSIGACYYKSGNLVEARKYFDQSLELSSNPFAEANALHFISHIKFDEGNFEEAEKVSLRQVKICNKNNYRDFEALGLRQLGKIRFQSGNFDEALDYFRKTLGVINSKGNRLIKFAVMKDIIDTYEKTGDKAKINELYPELYKEHVFHLENEMQLKIEQIDLENEAETVRKEVEKEKQNNHKLKKALKDVQALNDKLKVIHEEKNNLMGILAHDLKNPLQSILSSTRLMQSEKKDANFRAEMAKNIKQQSARMLNLINRLLDYRAIECRSIPLNITSFYPSELTSKLIKNANIHAVKKDIAIIYECNCDEKLFNTDIDLLYQVLENLLSNSVKFSTPGSKVILRCSIDENDAVFEIEDEGPGFTDDDIEKLYSNFARLSAQPTGNEHSTGLGLSIVKKLCDLLGGEIELKSELNKGSKFTIKLNNTK